MKRISIFIITFYFGAICVQQHTAAQPYTAPAGDNFRQEGIASWYGYEFDGRPTASGEIFNSTQLTAAHPTLPFGTYLLVTNRQNNRQVAVKVNDRGPFVPSRIIDVSRAAAEQLDMLITGTAPVTIERVPSNYPYAQQPLQQQPPAYYLPQQPPQIVYQQTPPMAYPQQPPQMVYPQQQIIPRLPPQAQTPLLPPQAQVPFLPPQQLQTPNLIPTPPPLPPQEAPPAAAAAPITVTVYPPQAQTPVSVQIAPNPADLPSGPRAKLSPSITPSPNKTYKLQIGSYKVAGNAVDAYVKLKAAGLEPSYERNANYFRVVLAGIRGTDIASVTEKLGSAGFREAVIREEN